MDKGFEQIVYLALGSALAVKEKVEKNGAEFKQTAVKAEQAGREIFDELCKRGEGERDKIRDMLKDVIKEVVAELDLATKAELEQLRKDLGH
jgi:polyhydroxyalkanoate synthesis regulator phasin